MLNFNRLEITLLSAEQSVRGPREFRKTSSPWGIVETDYGPINYESSLEQSFLFMMLADPQTTNISHQPIQINFQVTGSPRLRRYTPDYLIERDTETYAKSLVASTPQHQLVSSEQKTVRGLSAEQIDRMEREAVNLDREFKLIEQDYSTDHLDLVLAVGYLSKLIDSASVVRYLARTHPEILSEFQKIAQLRAAA